VKNLPHTVIYRKLQLYSSIGTYVRSTVCWILSKVTEFLHGILRFHRIQSAHRLRTRATLSKHVVCNFNTRIGTQIENKQATDHRSSVVPLTQAVLADWGKFLVTSGKGLVSHSLRVVHSCPVVTHELQTWHNTDITRRNYSFSPGIHQFSIIYPKATSTALEPVP